MTAARAAARLTRALDVAVADAGLSLPLYRLLAFLSGGPERGRKLAGHLEVSPPSLTALVDGAVARGLVDRVAVEDDRRCVQHRLTGAGARALSAADEAVTARIATLTGHLPPDQATAVWEGLRLLGQAIDAHHAGHGPRTGGNSPPGRWAIASSSPPPADAGPAVQAGR